MIASLRAARVALGCLPVAFAALPPRGALGRWEGKADELPAWAQRGRIIFIRNEGGIPKGDEATYAQWQPVLHQHGARDVNSAAVARCKALRVPLSLRTEGVMFFGDDRCVRRIRRGSAIYAYREHTWYWAYNWWLRDAAFREAARTGSDGKQVLAYSHNATTNREAGNVLSPVLLRMRREISQAILTPRRDPASTDNPLYPKHPYTDFDDCRFGRKGKPYDIYPIFGHLSMVWYDNPSMNADYAPASKEAWKKHFKEKFGVGIDAPANHPDERVRREWARFWAETYGRYYDAYYRFHQEHVRRTAVPETCRGLNGQLHCTVGMNASSVSGPGGARLLYLFAYHKPTDYPGMLVEYWTRQSHGKLAPMLKVSMAAMHGRPTGAAGSANTADAEALAVNGAIVGGGGARWRAYVQFGLDNRRLLTNALQGNTVGVLYNVRSGLVTGTLTRQYDLYEQLDKLGIPFDALVEEDLSETNADWLAGYAVVLVPGGEFNPQETAGLKRYVQGGGHLVLIGDVGIEQNQYAQLGSAPSRPFRLPAVPLAKAFGRNGLRDSQVELGTGTLTVCTGRVVPNDELARIIKPRLGRCYHVLETHNGRVTANVLRQPASGDARIIGLVNYTGRVQKNVRISLPGDLAFRAAAVVSPDGYACYLKPDGGMIAVPELYNYAMVVLGPTDAVTDAVGTATRKLADLVKVREPLKTP